MRDLPGHVYIAVDDTDRELLEMFKRETGATSDAEAFLIALRRAGRSFESPKGKRVGTEGNSLLEMYERAGNIRPERSTQVHPADALRALGGKTTGGPKGGGTGGLGGGGGTGGLGGV